MPMPLLALWLYWKLFGAWTPLVVAGALGLGAAFRAAKLRVRILLILAVGAVVSLSWTLLRAPDWDGFALNLGTELVGAAATYFLIDMVIGRREKQEEAAREREETIKNLVAQMGSSVHDVAVAAVDELRRRGHLEDGTLVGANLRGANLSEVDLSGAELHRAVLSEAELSGANLRGADLNEADISLANLDGANLCWAHLCGASLWGADLCEANMRWVELSGVSLSGAELHGADLSEANLGEANLSAADLSGANLTGTILPDRTRWTSDTDMARFTDPEHPNYWCLNDRESPVPRPPAECSDSI